MYVAACSEFPNDNPALHSGSIFIVEEVCGPPVVRMIGVDMEAGWTALSREIAKVEVEAKVEAKVEVEVEAKVEVEVEVEVEGAVEVAGEFPGEIDRTDVDSAVSCEPEVLSRPSGIYLSGDTGAAVEDEIVITPLEPLAEAEIFGEKACEEACAFGELVEIMAGVAEREEAGAGSWVRALIGDGLAPDGATDRVTSLVAGGILLADGTVATRFDAARRAWRAILRNESEDFGPCGALSLDEWAADAIARILGSASRAAILKRHLRDHGVAAFGLALRAA